MLQPIPNLTKTTPLPEGTSDRYRVLRDPWAFLQHCVYTRDQVDAHAPIKPAPADRDYLYHLTRTWQTDPLLAIVKSRRMWISWWAISLYLHDAITHTERDIFFVSKKEPDADDLLRRALFIYEHIPASVWPRDLLPSFRYKENHLLFPDIGSGIHAVAQGADQLRQYTASGLLLDEFGFWEKERETYTAARPTILGGGRVTIISTPPPQFGIDDTFFKKLVFDTI